MSLAPSSSVAVPAPISLAPPSRQGAVITLTHPAGLTDDESFKDTLDAVGAASKPGMPFGPREKKEHVLAYNLERSERMLQRVHDASANGSLPLFGADGLTAGDILDIINPLQHLPIIGTIYRWLTGDEISPGASLAGGALYGGPIGLAAAAGGLAFEQATGADPGSTLMAMATGSTHASWVEKGDEPAPAPVDPTTLAQAVPSPTILPTPAATAQASGDSFTAVARASGDRTMELPPSLPAVSLSEDQFTRLLSRPGDRADSAADPSGTPSPAEIQSSALTDRMLLGLRKYDSMTKARAATQPATAPAGEILDLAS